jgi:hypothetical protein
VADLEKQIAKEAQELKAAPVVTIKGAIVGRCGMCGQIVDLNELEPFDAHIPNAPPRMAGLCCHPHRTVLPVTKPVHPHG